MRGELKERISVVCPACGAEVACQRPDPVQSPAVALFLVAIRVQAAQTGCEYNCDACGHWWLAPQDSVPQRPELAQAHGSLSVH